MPKIKLVFLAILSFLLINKHLNAQNFPLRFSHITVDEGLSHTDSKDLKQDKQGFVWIGTLFGLDRYDGYQVKKFYNSNDPQNNAFKNRVKGIFPDQDGKIWLATDDGIQCFDSKTEKYLDLKQNLNSANSNASYTDVIKLKNNTLLAVSFNRLKIFKVQDDRLVALQIRSLNNLYINGVKNDESGNLWIASQNGLWKLAPDLKLIPYSVKSADKNYSQFSAVYLNRKKNIVLISGNHIYLTSKNTTDRNVSQIDIVSQSSFSFGGTVKDIIQDQHGDYWVSTDNGLLTLDSNLKLLALTTTKSGINGLTSNSLDKLFIDRSQCLWICTFGGGVDYTDLNAKSFFTFQHNPELSNTLSGNHIRSILEENKNSLWIGTNANGLNHYDYINKKFTFYNSVNSVVKLKSDQINSLTLDNNHRLWIGSSSGIEILNESRNRLELPPGYKEFPKFDVENITTDINGNIWFGSYDYGLGCLQYDKVKNKYETKYFNGKKLQNSPSNDMVSFIYADPNRAEIFVGTTHGLIRLLLAKNSEVENIYDYIVNGKSNSLSSNYIWPIQRQNDSLLWVGTLGGGLNRILLKANGDYSVTQYTSSKRVFNDVESLQIDNGGNIWMGGNGLECFNPQNKTLVKYDKNDGLQGNSFKVSSSCKGANGKLYFGGINGLNYFYPDSIKINKIAARPVLTDLVVNNQHVKVNRFDGDNSFLKQIISYTTDLRLSYLQNNFIISFSAMHFANPVKCQYRYKLEGYDKQWIYTDGTNPTAAYSNLNYNHYRFTVQAANNDGIWSGSTASVNLEMMPPWWKSTLAYTIYLLVFLFVLIWFYFYQARWFKLKRELALKGLEERKREELHQQQLQFFTNISHEFRTPLTLIIGPLENILKGNINLESSHYYHVMYRNARRLMSLINELMNFRKVADSVIKLHVAYGNISIFIDEIADEFTDLAESKKVIFSVIKPSIQIENFIDFHIIEKILFNLLNNAFKYTSGGGMVTLEIFCDQEEFKPIYENSILLENEYKAERYIYFRVADTGIGISKESITHIFDRYYRIGDAHLGSGVGLALVKSLALLHKGKISVYSERYKGTEIIIGLPLGEQNYSPSERSAEKDDQPNVKLEKTDTINLPSIVHQVLPVDEFDLSPLYAQKILIVEDNDDLRVFLKSSLQQYYHISEAVNGNDGLEIAAIEIPDLIISDVMMPVMDGIELCKQIKSAIETSHIPFMILTAKDALNAKLEGVGSGADYYFSKPLSIELLLLTIHNIFEQKQKLKDKYIKDYYSEATQLVQSEKDKEFMDKLLKMIDMQLHNIDLDIDYLCQHLYISRTKLCDKIKSISGQSAGDFIRTIRFKKAAYIMTHEDVPMSEVVERIGIQSNSYFSRAFKKEFGTTPSQFLQTIKKTHNVLLIIITVISISNTYLHTCI